MKSLKFLSVLFILSAVVFSSCSKQGKLEKRLDGKWNMDLVTYEERVNGIVDPASKESYSNFGEVLLVRGDKTNTGTLTMTFLGQTVIQTITNWTNTEDKLTIVSTDGVTSETTVFDIITNEKDKQEWTTTQTTTNGGITTVESTNYKLSRK